MIRMTFRTAFVALSIPVAGTAVAQTPSPPPPISAAGGDSMTLAQFQASQAQRMMAADANRDGRISLAEWTAELQARADRDHGGTNGGGGGGRAYDPARAFARIDTNGDGYLDRSEIDAASAERFRRMDLNGDGVVTPDERAARRGGMHPHDGRGGTPGDQPPPPSMPQP